MFGMSKWRRMRPRKNKRTKTWLQRKKKQPKQLSYIINPQPRWIWAPTWLPYDTRDPRLCRECDGFRVTLCVCLERSCVQLQLNRTSVGCSQARSERLRTGTKKQSQWQISTVLIRGARVQFHNFPKFLLSPDSYVYTHTQRDVPWPLAWLLWCTHWKNAATVKKLAVNYDLYLVSLWIFL